MVYTLDCLYMQFPKKEIFNTTISYGMTLWCGKNNSPTRLVVA